MHNSKAKPESIKLLSLNVRGLSNFHKRRAIFSWCRKQKADLIFLQETHSTAERQDQWRKEWGASVLFSHGSTNARGRELFLYCDYNMNDYNISPMFYKEMLHWWSDFRSRFDLVSLLETIIWNNHNIRVNGKPIFYNNYNSANIVLLSDLKFDLSNTESFNLAKQNGLRDSNFLTWTGVRCAVPSHLRIRSREVDRDHVRSLQFKIGDRIFDPALSKSRDFYGLLISSKATESRGFIKLKLKFSIDVEAKKAFSLMRSCIWKHMWNVFSLKY